MARRNKDKKKKRRRKGIGLVIIELILFLVIIGLIGGFCAYYFCTLSSVTVEGTELYTDAEITGYILDDQYSTNTIYVYLKNKVKPKGNAEFIDHFEVQLTGIHSVNILCVEKAILGYIQDDDSYIYFDFDGKITEISTTYIDGYMKVDGVTTEEPEVGNELPIGEDKVGFLLSAIKLVEKEHLMPNAINYDEFGRMTLKYDNYDICLGNSTYLEEKIGRLEYILPKIEGMSGTLHLENFSLDNTDIVFEKSIDVVE